MLRGAVCCGVLLRALQSYKAVMTWEMGHINRKDAFCDACSPQLLFRNSGALICAMQPGQAPAPAGRCRCEPDTSCDFCCTCTAFSGPARAK